MIPNGRLDEEGREIRKDLVSFVASELMFLQKGGS